MDRSQQKACGGLGGTIGPQAWAAEILALLRPVKPFHIAVPGVGPGAFSTLGTSPQLVQGKESKSPMGGGSQVPFLIAPHQVRGGGAGDRTKGEGSPTEIMKERTGKRCHSRVRQVSQGGFSSSDFVLNPSERRLACRGFGKPERQEPLLAPGGPMFCFLGKEDPGSANVTAAAM